MKVPAEVRRRFRSSTQSAVMLVLITTSTHLGEMPSVPLPGLPQAPSIESSANGQLPFEARRAYAEVLKLRPEPARTILHTAPPVAASTLLVADCADFTELMISQEATRYAKVVEAQDHRLELLAHSQEQGPLPRYAAAEIRLHQAASQVTFGHEVQGAWNLRQAYLQMQAVVQRYPDFLPARKTLGLCQFFIGALPPGYRWFLKLLGLAGSTEAGLQNLALAAQRPNDFQPEAQILLALIQESYYKRPEEAVQLLTRLAAQQPTNLLYTYLAISLHKRQHQTEQALAAYRARPEGAGYLPLPYLHHMAADLLLYQGKYAAAERANQLFLEQYHGQHYRKDAAFKLYLAAWLGGNAAAADRYRQQIDAAGRTVVEEDAYAQRFYDDELPLNRILTRARLQIDGGYYREALATLRTFSPAKASPPRDQLEWPYRRARAYHGLGRLDSARLFYTRTIALAGQAPYYFAPQAALQMGYLCQANGEVHLARVYFQKVLDSPKHEYKNSTDTKAKIALAGLK